MTEIFQWNWKKEADDALTVRFKYSAYGEATGK